MMTRSKEYRHRTGKSKQMQLTPQEVDEIIARYILGDSTLVIAEIYNRTPDGIRRVLKRNNIEIIRQKRPPRK